MFYYYYLILKCFVFQEVFLYKRDQKYDRRWCIERDNERVFLNYSFPCLNENRIWAFFDKDVHQSKVSSTCKVAKGEKNLHQMIWKVFTLKMIWKTLKMFRKIAESKIERPHHWLKRCNLTLFYFSKIKKVSFSSKSEMQLKWIHKNSIIKVWLYHFVLKSRNFVIWWKWKHFKLK